LKEQTVLFLSYAFPPLASSGTFRVARFAKYLPEFGWRPVVVSARPSHAIYNEVDPSLARLIPPDIVVSGTAVLRPLVAARKWSRQLFPRPSANGIAAAPRRIAPGGRAARPLHDLLQVLLATPDRHVGWILPAVSASLPLIRRHRPRVIFSSGPPHSAHLAAIILKQLSGLPVVCDLRDPWARNPWDATGSLLQQRAQSLLERLCVRQADTVILNTENACREFVSCYAGQNHGEFTVIPNGYDPALTPSLQYVSGCQASSGPGGRLRLCHCGSVYGNRSLLPLAKAAAKLKDTEHRFELRQVGPVAADGELRAYLDEHDLAQSILLDGEMPHDRALAKMAAANVLVVIQGGTGLQVPAKLFEMLPFRKPILALTGPGPTAEIVRNYDLGIVVDPDDHDAIATAVTRLAAGSLKVANECGAQRAFRDFDGRQLTGKLADVLRSCIQSGGSAVKLTRPSVSIGTAIDDC
jgi:glycosyltransferase involved in cell wall biosynthesis